MTTSVEQFWGLPDLQERLLLLLDPPSIWNLLQAGLLKSQVLKDTLSLKIWKKMIRQSSLGAEGELQTGDLESLVQILKKLAPVDLATFLLPLVHQICDKSPPPDPHQLWMGEVRGELLLTCPCQMETHKVSFPGFLILEKEVEGLLGSTMQSTERVSCKYNLHEPFLSALGNRISRQQSLVSMVSIGRDLEINSKRDVLAFKTLLQAEEVTMVNLKIEGEIGEEGWKMVATAMKTRPGVVSCTVWTSKEVLEDGRKEDIKDIWEAVRRSFFISESRFNMGEDDFFWSVRVEKPKDDWKKLERILEMEMGQFICELHEERVDRELELEEDNLYSCVFSDYSDYSDDEASAEDSEEDDEEGFSEEDEEQGEEGDGGDGVDDDLGDGDGKEKGKNYKQEFANAFDELPFPPYDSD